MRSQQHARVTSAATLLALLLPLTGCTSYPLGLSEAQWTATPPAVQAEYHARQSEIDAQNRRSLEVERLQWERREQERALMKGDRLATLYQEARYGDILSVSIEGGMVAFAGKRHPYEPVAFDLVRGESRLVEFYRLGRPSVSTSIEVSLSEDGRTFLFDAPARRRIVLVADGWERGRTYTGFPEMRAHDGRSEAVGISIRVRFRPIPPRPARLIIERR